MIRVKDLSFNYGNQVIYDNVSFVIDDYDKVGIVGVNGAGKTTLFKLLLKQYEVETGSLFCNNRHLGYLPQEIVIDNEDINVFEFVYAGRPIKQLQEQIPSLYEKMVSDPANAKLYEKQIGKINDDLDFYHQYAAEDELLELFSQMQIDDSLLYKKVKELSGGQKSKIAFARMLYSKPDIMLLDEPTNHLDASTKQFITNYLRDYHGTVLVISHDIDFLNQVVNKILFVNKVNHQATIYIGDYKNFKHKYAQEMVLKELRIKQQEREIEKLQEFIKRANDASRTQHKLKAMGQSKQKLLDKKLATLEHRDKKLKKVEMKITPIVQSERIPLSVDAINFYYPGDRYYMYYNLTFDVQRGERFLIVGENGIGKSTLLKLLVKRLTPTGGYINWSLKATVGYYAQELELLDNNKTVFQNVDQFDYLPQEIKKYLANFLFSGSDCDKLVSVLSPGEKARLSLCKLILARTNVIILDEPTNHFDPETQEIIGNNFKDFKGTLIVVSHNPKFVKQLGITRMLDLTDGRVRDYSEELLEYYYYLNTEFN